MFCSVYVVLGLSACGREAGPGTSRASGTPSPSIVITTAGIATGAVSSGSLMTSAGNVRAWSTAGEQTNPQITPRQGGPDTVFVVHLTSRTRLGAHGVLDAVYGISATGPSSAECGREATSTIDHGAAGERLTVVLRPGPSGGCRGDGAVWSCSKRGQRAGEASKQPIRVPVPNSPAGRPEWDGSSGGFGDRLRPVAIETRPNPDGLIVRLVLSAGLAAKSDSASAGRPDEQAMIGHRRVRRAAGSLPLPSQPFPLRPRRLARRAFGGVAQPVDDIVGFEAHREGPEGRRWTVKPPRTATRPACLPHLSARFATGDLYADLGLRRE